MLEVPRNKNYLTVVEERLCEIFKVPFFEFYENRPQRTYPHHFHSPADTPEDEPRVINSMENALPAPVAELVELHLRTAFSRAFDKAYNIALDKAKRAKKKYLLFGSRVFDDTPNTDMFMLKLADPDETEIRRTVEDSGAAMSGEQFEQLKALCRETMELRYAQGYAAGYHKGRQLVVQGEEPDVF